MSLTSTTTAADVMDLSAVLMNDPAKTDYTYPVLLPFLKMAIDELVSHLADSQDNAAILTSAPHFLHEGANNFFPVSDAGIPKYPVDLIEVQEILFAKDSGGTLVGPFIPLKRVEMLDPVPKDELTTWAFEDNVIKFNGRTSYPARWVAFRYLKHFSPQAYTSPGGGALTAVSVVANLNSRAYLAYKTASLAAMFVGENPERAGVLEAQAEREIERIESINNKGRQQMMTRHRPFRATFKMRGGW